MSLRVSKERERREKREKERERKRLNDMIFSLSFYFIHLSVSYIFILPLNDGDNKLMIYTGSVSFIIPVTLDYFYTIPLPYVPIQKKIISSHRIKRLYTITFYVLGISNSE